MTTGVQTTVEQRLIRDAVADAIAETIRTAFIGPEELEELLELGVIPDDARSSARTEQPAAGAYLTAISVEGFRGIGPTAAIEFPPGPGLTLVIGRNGSGKSSFAEALEV